MLPIARHMVAVRHRLLGNLRLRPMLLVLLLLMLFLQLHLIVLLMM